MYDLNKKHEFKATYSYFHWSYMKFGERRGFADGKNESDKGQEMCASTEIGFIMLKSKTADTDNEIVLNTFLRTHG